MTEREQALAIRRIVATKLASIATDQIQLENAKPKFLTEKEIKHTQEIREMLERDENPFSHLNTLTLGSNERPEKVEKELSNLEIKSLESKWKIVPITAAQCSGKFADDRLLTALGLLTKENAPTVRSLDKLYCSFCGNETPHHSATYGKLQPRFRKVKEEAGFEDGEIVIEDKVIVTSEDVVACPNCVLEIKPHVDKDGDVVRQGIKFRPFD